MQTFNFDPNGGAIFAEVRCGFGNPGGYVLSLWEKDSDDKAMPDVEGDFVNAGDDDHQLPTPASANDGRKVEAFVTVSPPPGNKQYSATLHITQDGNVLGDVTVSGQTDQPSVTTDLFAKLARSA